MYYRNYEDYMRSVLGYPIEAQNTYETYENLEMQYEIPQTYNNGYSSEIMNLYPEIYKVVNPMICKICDANTKPITQELLEQMTNEIYSNIEAQPEVDTVVNVKVNTGSSQTSNRISKQKNEIEKNEIKEVKEDRQYRPNNTLKDLIRILILNRLLGGFPLHRPPRPPRPPMRPPYPRNNQYEQYF